jgi:hypothetical protein
MNQYTTIFAHRHACYRTNRHKTMVLRALPLPSCALSASAVALFNVQRLARTRFRTLSRRSQMRVRNKQAVCIFFALVIAAYVSLLGMLGSLAHKPSEKRGVQDFPEKQINHASGGDQRVTYVTRTTKDNARVVGGQWRLPHIVRPRSIGRDKIQELHARRFGRHINFVDERY